MEDLEYALIQREKEDINPFDVSPSTNSSSNPPSFNISQSLQINLSKQSQDSTCSSSDDASWDIPWESSSGKYMTSTPLLSWQGQHEDPFTNPKNVVKFPPRRTSAPYTDLFDLDMYFEASLAINTIDLGVCSFEEEETENPFEDTFSVEPEPEPEPVVTVSPENSAAVAVPMNRSVKERDVYRPSGYTRSPRFRFSVDENGSPVPLRSPTQNKRRVGARMTIVDQVRAVLDSDNESGDEEEEVGGDDNDTSEISMPALKARLHEACSRKSGAADPPWWHTTTAGLGVTTSGVGPLLTGHGASQRKSMPLLTGSPRASLAVASHFSLAASPHASLPAATLTSTQHSCLTPSQHTSLSALRPSSRLLRDITNTMTSSSSSTSTLASMAHNPTTVQKNPISVLMQNPIKSETPMTMQENSVSTSTQNAKIKLKSQISTSPIAQTRNSTTSKTRNPIARFGRDIANIVVDDSANSIGPGGENTTMASVYTTTSVYSGENTMGSVYSVQNTMGSVYATTYPDEASARALKARLRQACDKITKSVSAEECGTVQSWEPVPF